MDSTTIPRGIQRDPSSAATPPRPDPTRTRDAAVEDLHLLPATARSYVETDRLAARIAANQVAQLEELALIGHSTCFDGATRSVVETSLRLAARRVLEEALGA